MLLGIIPQIYLVCFIEPSEYGKLAIIMLIYNGLNLIGRPAFGQARIQSSNLDHCNKNIDDVIFTINIIRAILVAGVLFGLSYFLEKFYSVPFGKLIYLLMAASIISGFRSPRIYLISKDLRFRDSFFIENSAVLTNKIIVIICAVLTKDISSILIGRLVGGLVRVIMFQYYAPYKYRLSFNFKVLKDYWAFGVWVTTERIITFLANSVESFVLGFVFNLQVLGVYNLAKMPYGKANYFVTNFCRYTLFSIVSKLKNEKKLSEKILKDMIYFSLCFGYVFVIIFPIIIRPLVGFLDQRWAAATMPAILLVSCIMPTVIIELVVYAILKSLGNARLGFHQSLVKTCVLLGGSIIFGKIYGLTGVVVLVILTQTANMLWALSRLNSYYQGLINFRIILLILAVIFSVTIPAYLPQYNLLFFSVHLTILCTMIHKFHIIYAVRNIFSKQRKNS